MYVVYLASDFYELPCAVLDSVRDVARWLDVDYWCAYRSLARGSVTKGYKIEYVKEA